MLGTQYAAIAEKLAKNFKVTLCAGGSEASCGETIIRSFGPRAFRRPMTHAEVKQYHALFTAERSNSNYAGAITQVVETLVQSPKVVYRPELGSADQGERRALNGYEIASELAYLLTDAPPDDALLAAAQSRALFTSAQREAEARRLLAGPTAKVPLRHFVEVFVGTSRLEELVKTPEVYPLFTPALRDSMKNETARFIDSVLWEGDGTLKTLLTANYSFVNSSLAKVYGVADPQSEALVKTALNPMQRAGLLTQASVLAAHSKASESFPIGRGKFVQVRLLCQVLPRPPQNLGIKRVPSNPALTTRERFAQHSSAPACIGCQL